MNCPNCGKEMEKGFVRAESFIAGGKWMNEKTNKTLGLESLAKPDALGFCFIEGHRCWDCHFVVLKY